MSLYILTLLWIVLQFSNRSNCECTNYMIKALKLVISPQINKFGLMIGGMKVVQSIHYMQSWQLLGAIDIFTCSPLNAIWTFTVSEPPSPLLNVHLESWYLRGHCILVPTVLVTDTWIYQHILFFLKQNRTFYKSNEAIFFIHSCFEFLTTVFMHVCFAELSLLLSLYQFCCDCTCKWKLPVFVLLFLCTVLNMKQT